MKIWFKLWLSFCSRVRSVSVLFCFKLFPFFFFSQKVLYYFIGKIFFRRTEAVAWRCSVLSISQNSSENTCVGVLSFSEVAGYRPATLLKRDSGKVAFLWILPKKKSRKSSTVDVRLGSKYALASGRYW